MEATNVATLPVPAAFDFAPRSLDEALRLAEVMSKSTIVPKDYIDKPGNVLVAMQWGFEVGLKPLQAMQNIAVINGRPSVWGDSLIAIVLASPLCEYIREGDSNDEQGVCRVKRRGQPEEIRMFTRQDAQKAGLLNKDGPWRAYPRRMLQMRARAWALRDVFPDVLRGMAVAEEVMDTLPPKDVTGESEATRSAPASRAEALKERIKAPKVEDVVGALDTAANAEDLERAVELAKKLKADADKGAANEAYHRALARLRKPAEEEDTRTDEEIIAEYQRATTLDALDLIDDGLRAIEEKRRALLLEFSKKRRAELGTVQ